MTVRMSTTVPWPNPSEVFALTIGGTSIPLILIAIMTFVLISSSGTMAMAVSTVPARPGALRRLHATDCTVRRHLRRDAGVRVDQLIMEGSAPGAIPGVRRSSALASL